MRHCPGFLVAGAGGHAAAADAAATLGLALSRLAGEATSAAGLVRILAFLAPEPVPLALLLARKEAGLLLGPEAAARVGPLPGDLVAAGDAITALRRYSLVAPAGDVLVLVHCLVQSITRGPLPVEEASERQRAAHEVLLGILALLHGASSSEVRHLRVEHINPAGQTARSGAARTLCRWISRAGRSCSAA